MLITIFVLDKKWTKSTPQGKAHYHHVRLGFQVHNDSGSIVVKKGLYYDLKPLLDTLYLHDQTTGIFFGNDQKAKLVPYFFHTFRYFIR